MGALPARRETILVEYLNLIIAEALKDTCYCLFLLFFPVSLPPPPSLHNRVLGTRHESGIFWGIAHLQNYFKNPMY